MMKLIFIFLVYIAYSQPDQSLRNPPVPPSACDDIKEGFECKVSSAYTDIESDCVFISEYKRISPVHFTKSECKAFGGYRLYYGGGSGSYGPILTFQDNPIDLHRPLGPHDLGNNKIVWVYKVTQDKYGLGEISYKALIFLMTSFEGNPDNRAVSRFHIVRLNGDHSCIIGKTNTKKEASLLANNLSLPCLEK